MMDIKYTKINKRVIAAIDLRGDFDAEKISSTLKRIKTVVNNPNFRVLGKRVAQVATSTHAFPKSRKEKDVMENIEVAKTFGLQLFGTKVCFSTKAEPAMAVYEIQYNRHKSRIFVELELIQD